MIFKECYIRAFNFRNMKCLKVYTSKDFIYKSLQKTSLKKLKTSGNIILFFHNGA